MTSFQSTSHQHSRSNSKLLIASTPSMESLNAAVSDQQYPQLLDWTQDYQSKLAKLIASASNQFNPSQPPFGLSNWPLAPPQPPLPPINQSPSFNPTDLPNNLAASLESFQNALHSPSTTLVNPNAVNGINLMLSLAKICPEEFRNLVTSLLPLQPVQQTNPFCNSTPQQHAGDSDSSPPFPSSKSTHSNHDREQSSFIVNGKSDTTASIQSSNTPASKLNHNGPFAPFLQNPVKNADSTAKHGQLSQGLNETGSLVPSLIDGEVIMGFNVWGEKRLCLPHLFRFVLNDVELCSIDEACNRLQITCTTCTKPQLDLLHQRKILPRSVVSCGLIRKSDAERLLKYIRNTPPYTTDNSLLNHKNNRIHSPSVNSTSSVAKIDNSTSDNDEGIDKSTSDSSSPGDSNSNQQPGDFIPVLHECFGRQYGLLYPNLYNNQSAKCIDCLTCRRSFSPDQFVGHTHVLTEIDKLNHWGFDSSNWRCYLRLYTGRQLPQKFKANLTDPDKRARAYRRLEEVKIKFAQPIKLPPSLNVALRNVGLRASVAPIPASSSNAVGSTTTVLTSNDTTATTSDDAKSDDRSVDKGSSGSAVSPPEESPDSIDSSTGGGDSNDQSNLPTQSRPASSQPQSISQALMPQLTLRRLWAPNDGHVKIPSAPTSITRDSSLDNDDQTLCTQLQRGQPALLDSDRVVLYSDADQYSRDFIPNISLMPPQSVGKPSFGNNVKWNDEIVENTANRCFSDDDDEVDDVSSYRRRSRIDAKSAAADSNCSSRNASQSYPSTGVSSRTSSSNHRQSLQRSLLVDQSRQRSCSVPLASSSGRPRSRRFCSHSPSKNNVFSSRHYRSSANCRRRILGKLKRCAASRHSITRQVKRHSSSHHQHCSSPVRRSVPRTSKALAAALVAQNTARLSNNTGCVWNKVFGDLTNRPKDLLSNLPCARRPNPKNNQTPSQQQQPLSAFATPVVVTDPARNSLPSQVLEFESVWVELMHQIDVFTNVAASASADPVNLTDARSQLFDQVAKVQSCYASQLAALLGENNQLRTRLSEMEQPPPPPYPSPSQQRLIKKTPSSVNGGSSATNCSLPIDLSLPPYADNNQPCIDNQAASQRALLASALPQQQGQRRSRQPPPPASPCPPPTNWNDLTSALLQSLYLLSPQLQQMFDGRGNSMPVSDPPPPPPATSHQLPSSKSNQSFDSYCSNHPQRTTGSNRCAIENDLDVTESYRHPSSNNKRSWNHLRRPSLISNTQHQPAKRRTLLPPSSLRHGTGSFWQKTQQRLVDAPTTNSSRSTAVESGEAVT